MRHWAGGTQLQAPCDYPQLLICLPLHLPQWLALYKKIGAGGLCEGAVLGSFCWSPRGTTLEGGRREKADRGAALCVGARIGGVGGRRVREGECIGTEEGEGVGVDSERGRARGTLFLLARATGRQSPCSPAVTGGRHLAERAPA